MLLTINQLIETLLNPDGLFRTLTDIYPLLDSKGNPRFTAHHDRIFFEISINDNERYLCCPLSTDVSLRESFIAMTKYAQAAPKNCVKTTFLDNEMTIFDNCGKPHQISVVLKSKNAGSTFPDFLQTAVVDRNVEALQHALDSVETVAETLYPLGLRLSTNFTVTPE